jgi:hypothetical protein
MTRQVCRQTKSLRRWARTVRTPPLLARNLFSKRHIHTRATHSFSSYSWEDISALGRAAILGSRRTARNPVHLAEILRRLPRGRLRRRCGRPRAPQRGLGSLRYVSSLSPITLENNPRPKTATGTDGLQTRSCRPRRSSASRSSCWRTSRITPSRFLLRRSDTTTRSGTSTKSRVRGGDRAVRWIARRGGSASPVWTSWACPRWKGERALCSLLLGQPAAGETDVQV